MLLVVQSHFSKQPYTQYTERDSHKGRKLSRSQNSVCRSTSKPESLSRCSIMGQKNRGQQLRATSRIGFTILRRRLLSETTATLFEISMRRKRARDRCSSSYIPCVTPATASSLEQIEHFANISRNDLSRIGCLKSH